MTTCRLEIEADQYYDSLHVQVSCYACGFHHELASALYDEVLAELAEAKGKHDTGATERRAEKEAKLAAQIAESEAERNLRLLAKRIGYEAAIAKLKEVE